MTIEEAGKIRGAVYTSARAASAYEMWRDYDRATIERDLAYAAKLKLNALRVFLSYRYWLEARGRLENSFYHLLQSAWLHKIRVLAVLFDCTMDEPPGEERNDPGKWVAIEDYVNWFMQRWSHEHRVLALEVVNEPETMNEFKFSRQMFLRASRHRKIMPLTFGAKAFEDSRLMQDLGLDILEVHQQSASEGEFEKLLDRANQTQEILNRPVLLTEWGGNYASVFEVVRAAGVGNFFDSLMVRGSRGIFHENGAVRSLAAARAISGDAEFSAEERA